MYNSSICVFPRFWTTRSPGQFPETHQSESKFWLSPTGNPLATHRSSTTGRWRQQLIPRRPGDRAVPGLLFWIAEGEGLPGHSGPGRTQTAKTQTTASRFRRNMAQSWTWHENQAARTGKVPQRWWGATSQNSSNQLLLQDVSVAPAPASNS